MTSLHRVAFVLSIAGLTACESGSGPGGLPVLPTVRTVHVFEAVDVACLTESVCTSYVAPTIVDVARDGDTVVVLYAYPVWNGASYSSYNGLAISHDLGALWEHYPYRPNTRGVLALEAVGARGVLVRGDEIYTLMPWRSEEGVLGRPFYLEVNRVELGADGTASGEYVGQLLTPRVHETSSGGEHHLYSHDYFGPSAAFGNEWSEWDPSTAARIGGQTESIPPGGDEPIDGLGRRWVGYQRSDGDLGLYALYDDPDRACMGYARLPDGWRPWFGCVPSAEWPIPDEAATYATTVVTGTDRPGVLFTEARAGAPFTRIARIPFVSGSARATAFDVGPGEPLLSFRDEAWNPESLFSAQPVHARFGDLVALVEDLPEERTRATLYRDRTSGAMMPTTLPTRPCREGVDCGYLPIDPQTGRRFRSTLQWALPLGADEYLIFYVVDLRPSSSRVQNAMLVARERLDRGGGTASGGIETACFRASRCAAQTFDVGSCVARWIQPQVAEDRRAAFVAATECSVIRDLEPQVRLGEACGFEGDRCEGGAAVTCFGGMLGVTADCAATGASCDLAAINGPCVPAGATECAFGCDGAGRLVYCGGNGIDDCASRGLECIGDGTFFGCARTGPECAGVPVGSTTCEGDRVLSCQEGGRIVEREDCSLVPGLRCDPGAGCVGETGCDGTTPSACVGSRLRYCLLESLREFDCASVGATCGMDDAGRAACR